MHCGWLPFNTSAPAPAFIVFQTGRSVCSTSLPLVSGAPIMSSSRLLEASHVSSRVSAAAPACARCRFEPPAKNTETALRQRPPCRLTLCYHALLQLVALLIALQPAFCQALQWRQFFVAPFPGALPVSVHDQFQNISCILSHPSRLRLGVGRPHSRAPAFSGASGAAFSPRSARIETGRVEQARMRCHMRPMCASARRLRRAPAPCGRGMRRLEPVRSNMDFGINQGATNGCLHVKTTLNTFLRLLLDVQYAHPLGWVC